MSASGKPVCGSRAKKLRLHSLAPRSQSVMLLDNANLNTRSMTHHAPLAPRTIASIEAWLSLAPSSPAALLLRADPASFFAAHLDALSPHLLALLGDSLSVTERGSIARIRARRARFLASLDVEEWMEEARGREPLLWKQLGAASSSTSRTPAAPPAAEEERKADTVIAPEEVDAQPQFRRLMSGIDSHERRERLERQMAKEAEARGEVETDSEQEEEEGEGDAFGEEMRRRFIWGDVSCCACCEVARSNY